MALQLSTAVRNALLDAFETAVGTAGVIKIFTGAVPANCAAANSGTELYTETLPTDWMNNAGSGSKTKLGTWQANAIATGTAGYWRLYASDGTTCHAQGTCSGVAGGGDMELQNVSIVSGQQITVTTFTLNAGNA